MTEAIRQASAGHDDSAATPAPAAPPLPQRIPAHTVAEMLAIASRAPSVHNTQPWRFSVGTHAIDLYADPERQLSQDRDGREMLISCGAALFGLRLAVRGLGYLPAVTLFSERSKPWLLARVALGPRAPATEAERRMLAALPHRHTHRGSFDPGPIPAGLLPGLQHDALAEGATLALAETAGQYGKLADLAAQAARMQEHNAGARAEIGHWSRPPGSPARDGVPAAAFGPAAPAGPGRLAQRDFDLGRHYGLLPPPGPDEPPPAATAVLVTTGDSRLDWLRAGQALHRVLAHAATVWVAASLHSGPLEIPVIRDLIRAQLALPGTPQMLLQFGPAHASLASPRRPVPEFLIEGTSGGT
ncbi:MAG TPA: nitroreductase family protein [Streptosporangiaceae bacterium]|nr:nitroreductase family protein [Streptosporangiaceae bacterium]